MEILCVTPRKKDFKDVLFPSLQELPHQTAATLNS